ncbi:MAG: hypothetical protein ACRDL7_04810, partial [Gaiellaceae bacterium]
MAVLSTMWAVAKLVGSVRLPGVWVKWNRVDYSKQGKSPLKFEPMRAYPAELMILSAPTISRWVIGMMLKRLGFTYGRFIELCGLGRWLPVPWKRRPPDKLRKRKPKGRRKRDKLHSAGYRRILKQLNRWRERDASSGIDATVRMMLDGLQAADQKARGAPFVGMTCDLDLRRVLRRARGHGWILCAKLMASQLKR